MRAERRAKQEARRAAKQQQQLTKEAKTKEPAKPRVEATCVTKEDTHEINLFKHLYHKRKLVYLNVAVNSIIHPAIVRLGV